MHAVPNSQLYAQVEEAELGSVEDACIMQVHLSADECKGCSSPALGCYLASTAFPDLFKAPAAQQQAIACCLVPLHRGEVGAGRRVGVSLQCTHISPGPSSHALPLVMMLTTLQSVGATQWVPPSCI